MKKKYTDTELLDYLQSLNDARISGNYSGKCILRWSKTGRGWRLHETTQEGATDDVRQAIINFIENDPEAPGKFITVS